MQGYDSNKEGNIERADQMGRAAFICDMVVVIMNVCFYILSLIAFIVVLALLLTGRIVPYINIQIYTQQWVLAS